MGDVATSIELYIKARCIIKDKLHVCFNLPVKDLKCSKIMRLFRDNFPCSEARRLGTFLDLPYSKLQYLSHNNTGNTEALMTDVLGYWVETDPEKSWSKLAEAVEDCGYGILAEKIRQRSSLEEEKEELAEKMKPLERCPGMFNCQLLFEE